VRRAGATCGFAVPAMPELAEVEFIRRQWDCGLRQKVTGIALHAEKRLFRGVDPAVFEALIGSRLLRSEARAKQMLFCFSGGLWLGIHLGMTGHLRAEPPGFSPEKHDHLVLFQKRQTLVFRDPRLFGRVRLEQRAGPPQWWSDLPPAVLAPEWTEAALAAFLKRRARLAIKAALLVQTAFPGIGNWMADEILWRARLHPQLLCGALTRPKVTAIWRESREVCRAALETVAVDYSDPPEGWLFHERWSRDGECPRDGTLLETATVGGRTTRWCPRCQKK
jgi:formamidopyrimidine-DNA glycosylase